ncbi:MAG TPA: 50S rRNA methyltransferase, partial [Enterococcus sp.]|nr:50S rRNA methyltransferase [Enterococcus sp.]
SYPNDEAKQQYSNERVVTKFLEHYPDASRQRVTHVFTIPEENRQDLLAMSPLEWGASEERKEKLRQAPLRQITVDVEVLIAKIS